MNWIRAAAVLAMGTVPVACGDTVVEPDDTYNRSVAWKGDIDAGQQLDIRGINGSVLVQRASGREAVIEAKIYGPSAEAAEVTVEIVRYAGGVLACARYPDRHGDLLPCSPNNEIWSDVESRNVRVEFTVVIPDDVAFGASIINGSVDADLSGDALAITVNGDINITTDGVAEGMTVNGSIDAAIGATAWGRALQFATVNGSVHVAIRPNVDVTVVGSTVNGNIASDFPLTITRYGTSRQMHGELGAGTWELSLSTVNGNVALREYP